MSKLKELLCVNQNQQVNQNNCLGCLCEIRPNTFSLYSFKLNVLVEILQIQPAPLCDKCYKQAQDAETFIQNVIDNQNMFKGYINSQDAINKEIINIKKERSPPKEVDSLEIEVPSCNIDTTIKTEIVFEVENEDYEINECSALNVNVKQEPIEVSRTEPSPSQSIEKKKDVSPQKRGKKKPFTPRQKKLYKDKEFDHVPVKMPMTKQEDIQIPTKTLTLEECMKEREEAANEQKYIDSKWKCTDCVKHFVYEDSLIMHMKSHSEERGDHECEICKLRYPTAEKVIEHKKTHFLRYICPKCNIERTQRATVTEHYETHHSDNKDMYECLLCAVKFPCYIKLRQHLKRAHASKRLQCPHCDITLSCRGNLRVHIARIHKKDETVIKPRPFTCDDCGASFYDKRTLALHMDSHSDTKKYYCVECDKYFGHRSTLRNHLKTSEPHVKYQDLPYKCPECDKRFGIRCNMTRHCQLVHFSDQFKCDQCDKVYKDKTTLKRHKNVTHNGMKAEKRFECPICNKKFTTDRAQRVHQNVHTGERPHACTKCSATFAHAATLYHHNNLVHLKKKRKRDIMRSKVKRNVDEDYGSD